MIRFLLLVSAISFFPKTGNTLIIGDAGPLPFYSQGPFYLPTPGENHSISGFITGRADFTMTSFIPGIESDAKIYWFTPSLQNNPQLGNSQVKNLNQVTQYLVVTKTLSDIFQLSLVRVKGTMVYLVDPGFNPQINGVFDSRGKSLRLLPILCGATVSLENAPSTEL